MDAVVCHSAADRSDITALFRAVEDDYNVVEIHGATIQFFICLRYNAFMENDLSLAGKKALVIGGTSSIGYALATILSQNGVHVTVTGRHPKASMVLASDKNDWRTKKNDSGVHGAEIQYIPFDFDSEGLDGAAKPLLRHAVSSCDILCVCYGPFVQKKFDKTTRADWEKLALADYALPGFLASTALQSMTRRQWGRILFFGGTRTDAVRGYATNAAYAGAKTGISVLVKSISKEYFSSGISCNAVLPGFTSNAPLDTIAVTYEQLAQKAYMLLVSPELNGVLLNVDYGWNHEKN